MASSRHTCQTAHDELGHYISIGTEDSGVPRLSPLQNSEPPADSPIGDISTFLHHNTPFHSPASPFHLLHQDLEEQTIQEHSDNHPSHSGSDIRAMPPSRINMASPSDILQQLVKALTMVGRNSASIPPAALPAPSNTHIRAPDAFNGSNPDDLQPFLLLSWYDLPLALFPLVSPLSAPLGSPLPHSASVRPRPLPSDLICFHSASILLQL